ncbi:MAG: phosphatidate cytidylyltransferase [Pseudomonadota bacterium]
MRGEVTQRVISGVALGVLVLALTWVGGLPFKLLSIIIMALIFFEWFRIVATKSLSGPNWVLGSIAIALVAVCVLLGWSGYGLVVCASGAVVLGIVRLVERENVWPSIGIIYAGIAGVAFAALRDSGPLGFAVIIFLFAVIWCTDIFAFFGGRTFGGPKLAPAISPNKTWSGFASGLIGGVLAGVIAALFVSESGLAWVVLLATIVSVAGQVGDLFESGLKRKFGVKDSGNLIPGHGGVMDRVDSLIFAAFAACIVALAMPGSLPENGGNGIAVQLLGH